MGEAMIACTGGEGGTTLALAMVINAMVDAGARWGARHRNAGDRRAAVARNSRCARRQRGLAKNGARRLILAKCVGCFYDGR